ncbi:heavy metal-associated isoprenylated plant protein 7-like [Typha latifolia]|uniref:heavy metal-associated isoprenylated plant protein 7-like n=1 Tax=Typha latifolia TaxID=4733 RepID=UPI003C2DC417
MSETSKKSKMGEEEEEEKKEGEEVDEKSPPPPPLLPPEEVVMRVFMHCEGCARKVRRSLRGFEGVEEVKADCKTHMVIVKGKKAAEDPMKVVERIHKKTGRKVELISSLPPPPPPPEPEKKEEEENPKLEEKKEQEMVMVVLKVHMHCDACAQEIKRRILRMEGVQEAESDLKTSQVTVKGSFNPTSLVDYVHKRTGKHALIVKQEPAQSPPPPPTSDTNDEKNSTELESAKVAEEEESKDGDGGGGGEEKENNQGSGDLPALPLPPTIVAVVPAGVDGGGREKLYHYYYPRYPVEYAYPPQIFSDENPNACAVM